MKYSVITGCWWRGGDNGGYYTVGNPGNTNIRNFVYVSLDDMPQHIRAAVCVLLAADRESTFNRVKGVGESERRSEDRYYFWIDQDYKLED